MRLGLFGGTFNPIHLAHLIIAEKLREDVHLDKVLFIPSACPPHKDRPATSPEDRLAMTRLAVSSNPFFETSDIEVSRGGRSYSIDTLRELCRIYPGDQFFFIIGMDAFAEIESWMDAPVLFKITNFLVIPRPGYPVDREAIACLPAGVTGEPVEKESTPAILKFSVHGGMSVFLVNTTMMEISSSDIRRRIMQGRSTRYLVPGEVASYIREKGLYRTKEAE